MWQTLTHTKNNYIIIAIVVVNVARSIRRRIWPATKNSTHSNLIATSKTPAHHFLQCRNSSVLPAPLTKNTPLSLRPSCRTIVVLPNVYFGRGTRKYVRFYVLMRRLRAHKPFDNMNTCQTVCCTTSARAPRSKHTHKHTHVSISSSSSSSFSFFVSWRRSHVMPCSCSLPYRLRQN